MSPSAAGILIAALGVIVAIAALGVGIIRNANNNSNSVAVAIAEIKVKFEGYDQRQEEFRKDLAALRDNAVTRREIEEMNRTHQAVLKDVLAGLDRRIVTVAEGIVLRGNPRGPAT